jgi:hypothetical protein
MNAMSLPISSMPVLRAPESSGCPGRRAGRPSICSVVPGGGGGHSKGNAPPSSVLKNPDAVVGPDADQLLLQGAQ